MIDHSALQRWFQQYGRDLPWRDNPSPYVVWVSEVMLQQTQVAVVVSYFEKWMEQFPTIETLAAAPLEVVIKAWEGLGYYSRARNLHAGASYVMEHFGGNLPADAQLLSQVKGLGPYTIGAILSFAFHQRAAAVDGNVLRVLSRYWNIPEDISKGKTVSGIRQRLQEALPEQKHWLVSEGLIELGAMVCGRTPKCELCPLSRTCQGLGAGTVRELPYKSAKVRVEPIFRAVAVVVSEGHILVRCCLKGEIMSGLYEFPYFELKESGLEAKEVIESRLSLKLQHLMSLECVKHSFTRYRVSLFPHIYSIEKKECLEGYEWVAESELEKIPFSSGHRRVLQLLRANEALAS